MGWLPVFSAETKISVDEAACKAKSDSTGGGPSSLTRAGARRPSASSAPSAPRGPVCLVWDVLTGDVGQAGDGWLVVAG